MIIVQVELLGACRFVEVVQNQLVLKISILIFGKQRNISPSAHTLLHNVKLIRHTIHFDCLGRHLVREVFKQVFDHMSKPLMVLWIMVSNL